MQLKRTKNACTKLRNDWYRVSKNVTNLASTILRNGWYRLRENVYGAQTSLLGYKHSLIFI